MKEEVKVVPALLWQRVIKS